MATATPKIVLGAGPFGAESDPLAHFHTPDKVQSFLNIFREHGYKDIDTARNYSTHAPGTSEPLQGQTDFASWAVTDSKIGFTGPGSHTADKIELSIQQSLEALGIDSVNIMYLHSPDRQTPLDETCRAMAAACKAGKFKNWGLSNFRPDEVETVMEICMNEKLIPPAVYQGQYNVVARLAEDELVPILRRHNLSYYSFSPGASGIFSDKWRKGQGRWGDHPIGKLYSSFYHKDEIFESAQKVQRLASEHGISGHAVALRWVMHHSILDGSKGDAMIIGANSNAQLEENLEICKQGPLPEDIVKLVEEVWSVE